MANRKYRYADWLLKTGSTKTNPVTNTFAGFVNVDQNNKRVANSKITTNPYTGQMVYTSRPSYSDYEAQIEQNDNAPEVTPNYGMYAAPQPVQASPFNYGAPKLATAVNANTDAGKVETDAVSTGSVPETDASGYAEYLAQHPEIGEAEKKAESEYARQLANYGVNAENLAQMGIHGGLGEYVNASAYAQLQERKAEIGKEARQGYAAYLQNKEANSAVRGKIYSYLTGRGYEDEDGNTVQGVNLTAIKNDEDYAMAKAMYKQDLIGRGASEADIDAALADVDSMRQTIQQQTKTDIENSFAERATNGGVIDQDQLLESFGYNVKQGYDLSGNAFEEDNEAFESRKGQYVLQALDTAVENGWITPEQRSATIKDGLPMYSAAYSKYKTNDIEGKGKKLSDSVLSAVVMHDQGKITDADFKQILADAEERIKAEGVTIKYEKRPGWDNIEVKIGTTETIHADDFGNVTPAKEEELNKRFGNEASVNEKGIIAIDFDGSTTKDDDGKLQYNYTLYYREGENARWQKLRTKEGSVSDTNGGARTGDNWLAVLAVLEQYNKDTPSDFATFYNGTENKPTSGQYAAYELSKKTTAPNAANRQFETAYPSYAKFGK